MEVWKRNRVTIKMNHETLSKALVVVVVKYGLAGFDRI